MTEKQQKAYDRLLEIDRKITMIGHIEAVLGYDFETVMSKMGGDERSRQMAFLSSMVHEMSTSKELGECLETLSGVSDATDEQKALVVMGNQRIALMSEAALAFPEGKELFPDLVYSHVFHN